MEEFNVKFPIWLTDAVAPLGSINVAVQVVTSCSRCKIGFLWSVAPVSKIYLFWERSEVTL